MLTNFLFTSPWILGALLTLPVLWYLLRIVPPAPKLVRIPTARFLKDLVPDKKSASHTPLWLLILRMMIVALIILALAGPVYNPGSALKEKTGPLRLLIDNGWSAAQSWDGQMEAAGNLLAQADRQDRTVFILTTAPRPGREEPYANGPLVASKALGIIKGLEPRPWASDYKAVLDWLQDQETQASETIWLSDGLYRGGMRALVKFLTGKGSLSYISPGTKNLPLALGLGDYKDGKTTLEIYAPETAAKGRPVNVQALSEDGRVLGFQSLHLSGENVQKVTLDVPESLRGDVAQYRLAGNTGAGGIFLLDERFKGHAVGIAAEQEDAKTAPLVDEAYYLRRALEPYASLSFGTVEELLAQELSMIILPDIAGMPVETLNALEDWVSKGGLLLRFAGPNMGQSLQNPVLVPVPLRQGGRTLEGALSWEKPLKLAPFPENSPFYGMPVPEEITIRQQILASPSEALGDKSWAMLEDGTPLITAAQKEKGMIVLVHTTAGPAWSDLALSGLFVDILKRLRAISGFPASQIQPDSSGALDPVFVLDGFGARKEPGGFVKPIQAADLRHIRPSSVNPPGLYQRGGFHYALNIGEQNPGLKAAANLPFAVEQRVYGKTHELNLQPFLFYAAAALFLVDWLIMGLMGLPFLPRLFGFLRKGTAVFILFVPVSVQAADQTDYAYGLYLAYIKSGNAAVDARTQEGLENLADELKRRTSAEPDGIAALDPEKDALAFFPLIYWPVAANQPVPSTEALQNIQGYLDHGGTILFDLREGGRGGANAKALQAMTASLNIPPLVPVDDKHVLTKTFYLLETFPGRYSSNRVWVERESIDGRDGVSSVIIGSNDWASAWAAKRSASSLMGGARQREMAVRSGVNMMMYALTGNYKEDQVHVPHILERLDR